MSSYPKGAKTCTVYYCGLKIHFVVITILLYLVLKYFDVMCVYEKLMYCTGLLLCIT